MPQIPPTPKAWRAAKAFAFGRVQYAAGDDIRPEHIGHLARYRSAFVTAERPEPKAPKTTDTDPKNEGK